MLLLRLIPPPPQHYWPIQVCLFQHQPCANWSKLTRASPGDIKRIMHPYRSLDLGQISLDPSTRSRIIKDQQLGQCVGHLWSALKSFLCGLGVYQPWMLTVIYFLAKWAHLGKHFPEAIVFVHWLSLFWSPSLHRVPRDRACSGNGFLVTNFPSGVRLFGKQTGCLTPSIHFTGHHGVGLQLQGTAEIFQAVSRPQASA